MKLHFTVFLCYSFIHVECNLFDDQQITNADTFHSTNPEPQTKTLMWTQDEEYYQQRCAEIISLRTGNSSNDPYPHKFHVTPHTEAFLNIGDGMLDENVNVSIAGRVLRVTKQSKTTVYKVITADFGLVQVAMINSHNHPMLKRGDIVGAKGHPGKTPKGYYYIFVKEFKLLAPCLHKLPTNVEGNARYVNRYLDLILNDETMDRFQTRAKIISIIRKILDEYDFMEVETPILNKIAGGATAVPFQTHHDSTNKDYFLRIAPELFHKMLIVGGMNRIYEIGRVFRNEEIDSTHNPEFTSLELYMAYADYHDMMTLTETLISNVVMKLFGTLKIKYHLDGPEGKEVQIDFTPPYVRKPMIPTLEEQLNVTFPPADKLMDTPEGLTFLINLANKYKVKPRFPRTSVHLLQKLVKTFISDKTVDPIFITDFPQTDSPLAKYHRHHPGLAERFELYAVQKEIGNSYTEMNDPFAQRRLFAQQDKQREEGDIEIPPTDKEFIKAMEYGLPPTAGLGIGIDRLVMLLTDSSEIQDVILFPAINSVDQPAAYSPSQDVTEP